MPFAPPQAPMCKIFFSFANKIEIVPFIKSKVTVMIKYIRMIMLCFLAYPPQIPIMVPQQIPSLNQVPIIPQQPICPSGFPSGPGGFPIYAGID